MDNKKKKSIILITFTLIILVVTTLFIVINCTKTDELISVKSKKDLEKLYNAKSIESNHTFIKLLTMPFSALSGEFDGPTYYDKNYNSSSNYGDSDFITNSATSSSNTITNSATNSTFESSSNDYSKTNIQVENVDEADITKTDGKYIYSLTDKDVIITNVENPAKIYISSRITLPEGIPEELMLYNDKLAIIASNNTYETIVYVYDISNKESPKVSKSYKLYEPYYTSRAIDGKLYVISSGSLRKDDNNDFITYYSENNITKELSLDNIKYMKKVNTKTLSFISVVDMNDISSDVSINAYFLNINNAYISQNNIYLLNEKYSRTSSAPNPKLIFGFKGALGILDYEDYITSASKKTDIYKFNILNDGSIKYETKTKTIGSVINQFSLDEYEGNLRVALYDSDGSRVVIFDKNLKEIGRSDNLAKGEKMYSSRFIGNKVYLVTYKTVDPLYVIDLSVPSNIKVLGALKIPGYSTYLHPYDENHIIGIGMETKENIRRDVNGKVISTTSSIIGMKMALFDVSDVNNPIQISSTVIGDSRSSSAILTNHKALLFSKEKELIAIPVNNYNEDFNINTNQDTYSSIINSYTNYKKSYVSEGYFVYKININDGFTLKGTITHDKVNSKYAYSTVTKLLRGLYIDDNLYTVSQSCIKVNKLENLEQISQLKIDN